MSGGHYNYKFFQMEYLAEELEEENVGRNPGVETGVRAQTARVLRFLADVCRDIEWGDSGDGCDWEDVARRIAPLAAVLDDEGWVIP